MAAPEKYKAPHWATLPERQEVRLHVRRSGSERFIATHALGTQPSYVIGRLAGLADVVIDDSELSRQHAALVHCKAKLYLIDLRSAKGVFVGGTRLKPMEPLELREDATFRLGESSPLRFVVRGLVAPPPLPPPPPAAAAAAAAWTPPEWARTPTEPVEMILEKEGRKVQSLDISRHPSYTLGRAGKIVVPDESVSRVHAALIHGPAGPDGRGTVHVIDFDSTKGSFIDQGSGWKRMVPQTPTLLPPGGKVRLGECSTLIVYPAPPPPPPAPPAPPPKPTSLLSATVLKHQAAAETSADVAADEELDGEVMEEEEAPPPVEEVKLSNADFRNALMPFLTAPRNVDNGDGKKGKRKKRKGAGDSDDEDSDVEPAPPLVLDKVAPENILDTMSGGLVLRKEKTKLSDKRAKKKEKTMKIKF